jgi:CBS domain-containing protein
MSYTLAPLQVRGFSMVAGTYPEDRKSEYDEAYGDDRELRGAFFGARLSKVPRRPTLVLSSTESIETAIRAMNERHVGCALIVQNGKLAGIFTERDVLRKVAGAGLPLATTPVSKVMTPDPVTLGEDASIAYALHHMSVEGYRHLPLIKEDRTPVGVVGVRDIITWMVELFPESVLNLPPDDRPPKTVDGG